MLNTITLFLLLQVPFLRPDGFVSAQCTGRYDVRDLGADMAIRYYRIIRPKGKKPFRLFVGVEYIEIGKIFWKYEEVNLNCK